MTVVAVGSKMPAWVNSAFDEYAKRFGGEMRLQLLEVPACKRGKNADIPRILADEGKRILEKIPPRAHIVTLDVIGTALDTLQFAQKLQHWRAVYGEVAFVIGGAEGLAEVVNARAKERISLSKLTMAHPLVRVVLAEALYRAYTLTIGHPYHRE